MLMLLREDFFFVRFESEKLYKPQNPPPWVGVCVGSPIRKTKAYFRLASMEWAKHGMEPTKNVPTRPQNVA